MQPLHDNANLENSQVTLNTPVLVIMIGSRVPSTLDGQKPIQSNAWDYMKMGAVAAVILTLIGAVVWPLV